MAAVHRTPPKCGRATRRPAGGAGPPGRPPGSGSGWLPGAVGAGLPGPGGRLPVRVGRSRSSPRPFGPLCPGLVVVCGCAVVVRAVPRAPDGAATWGALFPRGLSGVGRAVPRAPFGARPAGGAWLLPGPVRGAGNGASSHDGPAPDNAPEPERTRRGAGNCASTRSAPAPANAPQPGHALRQAGPVRGAGNCANGHDGPARGSGGGDSGRRARTARKPGDRPA